MNINTFGLNLAKKRIKLNISAYELSLRLGKDATYVNKVENGKIYPSLPMVFEIANALDIEPSELFVDEK